MFETRKMKNTDDVRRCSARLSLARSSGRIITIEAPVVPMRLASTVPIRSRMPLVSGLPCRLPLILIPPAMVKSANSSRMNGM